MILIGIGNYIGTLEVSVTSPIVIDNVIISENGFYIITEQGKYIENEKKEEYFLLDISQLDIGNLY